MDIPPVYLWLALGAGLQLFGFGRWMTPLAAWLAPVFLLHFAHTMPPLAGMLWIWFALATATAISMRGIVPIPGIAYLILPIATGLFGALPFLIDRLMAPLIPDFWSTLVFPAAWTAIEFLGARTNPYGTWGSTGYTQHGVLPLMQLASVTGIWGIGFLVGWFAAVVNWAWDQQWIWTTVQHGALIFVITTIVIFLLGGMRVALARDHTTVRIAGIGWPKGIVEREKLMRALNPAMTAEEHKMLREAFARIRDSFLARSEREARAGARIIVWPEANLIVFMDEEAAFLERARMLARTQQVYLVMGMATLRPGERHTFRNHALLLSPAGETLYDYTKITAVPGFEKQYAVPGDKPIAIVDTEFGRLCSPICFDMDFDNIIRQAGRGHTDLMLVPASDWKEIMPIHQQMAEFRAIENGAALFRITRWGGSGAVDRCGRSLAWMDDFAAQDNVMIAQVPVQAGVRTIYARLGDAFAWTCVGAVTGMIGLFVVRMAA